MHKYQRFSIDSAAAVGSLVVSVGLTIIGPRVGIRLVHLFTSFRERHLFPRFKNSKSDVESGNGRWKEHALLTHGAPKI